PQEGYQENDILTWAASLEQNSEHPIATGIVRSAKEKGLDLKKIEAFESITGKGIEGNIESKKVNVVSPGYVDNQNMDYDMAQFETLSEEGKTVVFVLRSEERRVGKECRYK